MQTTWLERGTVSGRVALLLRSAEIQPLFIDLSDWIIQSPPSIPPMGACDYRVACLFGGSACGQGDALCFDSVLQAAAGPCCYTISSLILSDWTPSSPPYLFWLQLQVGLSPGQAWKDLFIGKACMELQGCTSCMCLFVLTLLMHGPCLEIQPQSASAMVNSVATRFSLPFA